MNNSNTVLTLFFTGGVSLRTWVEIGNLDREVAIYKRLAQNLGKVNFVTYGGNQDRMISDRLDTVKLLPAVWHRRDIYTVAHLMLKYFPKLQDTDVIKTNQIIGSEVPIWFKKILRKKLIVRCGYLHSFFMKKISQDEKVIEDAVQTEKRAFRSADAGIVTSQWQKDLVIEQYKIDPEKIKVIPNYVVTDVFRPDSKTQKKYDLIFVGRGDEQKNVDNLLRAIQYLKIKNKSKSLLMVGQCSRNSESKKLVEKNGLNVTFKNNVPNIDLPPLLNQSKVFILPSFFEGHPKVLLEAMSCGLPCIGTRVRGIEEDIEHMKTGYLCDTDYESIAHAIETVLSNESLQRTIGKNAREYILREYDIDTVSDMELDVISEVVSR